MTDRLTREQLEGRLGAIDYPIAMDMRCAIMDVSAYRSERDAKRATNAVNCAAEARAALFYRLVYRIKTLLGPGKFSDPEEHPVVAIVDLNAKGNYPFTPPECFASGTIPWSPHFDPGGPICYERPGGLWRSDGKTTVGHVIRQLAFLINLDEAVDGAVHGGYQPDAASYWQMTLGKKPITAGLVYPALPDWFLAGVEPPANETPRNQAAKARIVLGRGETSAAAELSSKHRDRHARVI